MSRFCQNQRLREISSNVFDKSHSAQTSTGTLCLQNAFERKEKRMQRKCIRRSISSNEVYLFGYGDMNPNYKKKRRMAETGMDRNVLRVQTIHIIDPESSVKVCIFLILVHKNLFLISRMKQFLSRILSKLTN